MTPIVDYLTTKKVLEDKNKAIKLRRRSSRYCIIDGKMYKKGFSSPLPKCVHEEKVKVILEEVYRGECGGHSGPRMLAHKILIQGFYWLTMHKTW